MKTQDKTITYQYGLRRGNRGQEVRRLQKVLACMGREPGEIDGIYGPKTAAALASAGGCKGEIWTGNMATPEILRTLGIPVDFGVDISHHQGKVKFNKMAKTDVRFCICKVSEGTTHKHPSREEHFKGLEGTGIIPGAYHFARADTNAALGKKDAKNEADNFLSCYTPFAKPGHLAPALDLEKGLNPGDLGMTNRESEEAVVQFMLVWLERVEKELGVMPFIYTASWAIKNWMDDASPDSLDELVKYPLWGADYQSMNDQGVEPEDSWSPWSSWEIWQWGNSGSVPGVKGGVDQNWARGGLIDSGLHRIP